MDLDHSFTVPVGIDDAWKVLLDIEQVAPCMPGAALDSVDGDDFTGTVKVKVGPIGLTYKGKASFVEKDEAAHRAVIDARGRDTRGNGTASAKVTATLSQSGDSSTKVDVRTELDITGKPAQFGRGVMVDVGNKLIGQFADCLAGKLSGAEEAPGAGATSAAAEPAAAVPTKPARKSTPRTATKAASKAAAKSTTKSTSKSASTSTSTSKSTAKDSGQPEVEPAAESPSTSAPTAAPSRTMMPADDVEPIDLLQTAGPAIAKRLIPVVAALVLILLIVRRRRH